MLGKHFKFFEDRKIGEGAFGKVYLGQDLRNGRLVAIKTEKRDKKSLLKIEYHILSSINKEKNGLYALWYGTKEDNDYLITNLLGSNLKDLQKRCLGHFSLKTSLMLLDCILSEIKYYHNNGIIHRDIKPSNFLVDYEYPQKKVYLIDFGLAKKYIKNGKHIEEIKKGSYVGTVKYMSVSAHEKMELSRKDDMYSIGYMLLAFITGHLKWQGIKEKDKQKKYQMIYNIKKSISLHDLLEGVECEDCYISGSKCSIKDAITKYFEYLKNCDFQSSIDYQYLIELFTNVMKNHNYSYDFKWDWI